MGNRRTTIKERWEQDQARERNILDVLVNSNKRLDDAKEAKRHKKKTVGELWRLINTAGVEAYTLRPAEEYIPRSYNLEKQIYGLIDHLYVRYRVPSFMYQAFQTTPPPQRPGSMPLPLEVRNDPITRMHAPEYRQWFIVLAQGGSFRKLVASHMTSREAAVFLKAPPGNLIHENVWWARMTVAGVPESLKSHLLRNILGHYYFADNVERLRDVIAFFARHCGEMDKVTIGEVIDFLAWKLRFDLDFSIKGRTVGSIVRLCDEWHVQMQKAKLGSAVVWPGTGKMPWQYVGDRIVWQAMELRSNKDLLAEGRKQRHCVYSYVQQCLAGRSFIFSLRGSTKAFAGYDADGKVIWDGVDEQTRLTVEVNARGVIVQIRGQLNRKAVPDEMAVLRRWSGELGFTFN